MTPLVREWVQKAEADFSTAAREFRVRKNPNHDAVCFHAQQCAEKYLKALLQERKTVFGKTHSLIALLELLLPVDKSRELFRSDLHRLSAFAVHVRYPGESADRRMAQEALQSARAIRLASRRQLGLKG